MTDAEKLAAAQAIYDHALDHYGDADARWDVIVECMGVRDIAAEFGEGAADAAEMMASAAEFAGLQKEQELNQAWGAPGESPY